MGEGREMGEGGGGWEPGQEGLRRLRLGREEARLRSEAGSQ